MREMVNVSVVQHVHGAAREHRVLDGSRAHTDVEGLVALTITGHRR